MLNIAISPDGKMSFIYGDAMLDLVSEGDHSVTRASHVEPVTGGWMADMSPVNGPTLMADGGRPFGTRQEALDAEVTWLNKNIFHL